MMKHVISVQIVIMKQNILLHLKSTLGIVMLQKNTSVISVNSNIMLNRVNLHMTEKHGEKKVQCDSCDFTSPSCFQKAQK
jgi:hypothetical protein